MNRMCFRPRPLKIAIRLKSVGSHPNFKLPFQGWWAITGIAGGGGSGATHSSYADPSERGSNGGLLNVGYTYRTNITATPVVGNFGAGGTLTNNSDIAAQRGKVGGDTTTGIGSRSGGAGGKCAFEQTGLNPTAPLANYPASAYDSRTVSGTYFCGVFHDSGSVTTSGGNGAAGRTSPGQAGLNGETGRVDYYCRG